MSSHTTINEQAGAYLRNRVMTAKPEELRLILIEGAIRFSRMALDGLHQQDNEKVYDGLSQCQPILLELINALDQQHDPVLCDRLSGLYAFMYNRTIDAGTERKPEYLEEVIELLEYERETWVILMQQLGDQDPRESLQVTSSAEMSDEISQEKPRLSIQG